VTELQHLLDQIDTWTKALATAIVSSRYAELSREARMDAVAKLRESYLRMGNVLEEWKEAQTPEQKE